VVLRECTMPAVLFECGIIKSSAEELRLGDKNHQQRQVNAMVRAIHKFFPDNLDPESP
jgi:N-acetylmuramoyl-L-alanine amidase